MQCFMEFYNYIIEYIVNNLYTVIKFCKIILVQYKNNIIFGKPNITHKEISGLVRVAKSNWIGTGAESLKFENRFSIYKEARYAKSLNSCTAALHLSLKTLKPKNNDEVITTPFTFAATINSIILAGCKPVLVDVRKDTFNIDENLIEKKITKKTIAILVVHYAGIPCDMNPILKIAKKYNLKIIEDCAHAIETKYNGKHAGTFGYAGCFSFYVNKNITTGEGGMLICKNRNLAEKIQILRLHGMSRDAWKRYMPQKKNDSKKWKHYDILDAGLKYNMIDINAAIGLAQLKKVNIMWKERKKIAETYRKQLNELPLIFQETKKYKFKHAYHLFPIVIDKTKTKLKRDDLLFYLKDHSIGAGVNYRSATDMKYYKKKYKWNSKTCKISDYVGKNVICLPLYPGLKRYEQKKVINVLVNFFKKKSK
jgi:dTDP-4-amino-4,6-dideoxygalactose transaminase